MAYDNTRPSMELSRSQRFEIFFSGMLMTFLISAIYLIAFLFLYTIIRLPSTNNIIISVKLWLTTGDNYTTLTDVITIIYVVALFGTLITQTRRRIERARLEQLLSYIVYMGEGNYDIRIPIDKAGRYEDLAYSVNDLMDNIEESIRMQEESERTKDELITNIGHDIRTPLTSVIGYLRVLESQRDLPEVERYQYLSIAKRKAQDMDVLVNDLFDYTKSLDSSMKLNYFEDMSIDQFFDQIVSEFQLEASKKDVKLKSFVSPEELVGSFDPERMARVFGNLVTNALKYGVGASHVILTARAVTHETYQLHEREMSNEVVQKRFKEIYSWLIFEVRNNGELLSEEELEVIYNRSYRGDKSRTANVPGSGLGLSIVRNIVHLHGGNTYAEIDGEDLVFRVDLPQGVLKEHKLP